MTEEYQEPDYMYNIYMLNDIERLLDHFVQELKSSTAYEYHGIRKAYARMIIKAFDNNKGVKEDE